MEWEGGLIQETVACMTLACPEQLIGALAPATIGLVCTAAASVRVCILAMLGIAVSTVGRWYCAAPSQELRLHQVSVFAP
jgi:hypothetical protein